MADQIDNELNESGYTTFGGTQARTGSVYTPTGPIGRFFAKFFATKAQLPAARAMDQGMVHPDAGDTVINTDVIKDQEVDGAPAVGGIQRNPIIPQLELNRRRRYKEYEEMDEYRRAFVNEGEDRRPTLTWPRQIPLAGEPADVVEIVQSYADWLSTSELPKLFINPDPGSILIGPQREFCRAWPNQTEITVAGRHFIQEDSADEIGEALAEWLPRLA